ncbi:MAG TPA: thiamine pyrophosphate-binding protein [Aldersonia sp.]
MTKQTSARPGRVVDYLVDAITALGVDTVFGVDGANIEDLYDAAALSRRAGSPGITAVVAKHEFGAATMADGYARVRSGLGVVAATSGGGAMNLVAGLSESFESRVPVLALVGQPPRPLEGHGAFQDTSGRAGTIDATALFGAITRYCARVDDPADIADRLRRAVTAALSGGPAVLLLPKDVQQAEVDLPPFVPPPIRHAHDTSRLLRLRASLAARRRTGKIVIVAGDQVARNDARAELRDLATTLDASVGVLPDAKDVYGPLEPGYCGVAGIMGHTELGDAIRGSAACLFVGTRMPVTGRGGLDPAFAATTLLSIGADAPHVDAAHATSTDLRRDLRDLAEALDEETRPRGGEPVGPLAVPPADGPGLRYRDAVEAIGATLRPGTAVFADAGNTGAAVVHHLPIPRDGRFVVALGMGGMGYSFGAGVGAAFARPEERTVVIAGDGAFFMHGMEIHTAVEHRLPITFMVFNNNAHAMCVTREQLYYGGGYSFNRFAPTRIGEGVAAMFPGLKVRTAATLAELDVGLRDLADAEGPAFLALDCDPDEIPPFVPFLAALPAHTEGASA